MTHPTPTAATSASPPPRGEGMGVGGRPLCTKPRPGPGPGPLSTAALPGVPGRARGGVVFLLTLLLPLPTLAQVIPTGTPAADILLSRAIADQRVFLTCTALDPENHQIARAFWQADTTAAVTILTAHQVPPEAITAFTTAAQPENLLPPEDTSFAEVQHFCAAQDQWFLHWSRRNFTVLSAQLPEAFE